MVTGLDEVGVEVCLGNRKNSLWLGLIAGRIGFLIWRKGALVTRVTRVMQR
jgi:hypothetical protein